jgi:hypothetical protein
MKYRLKLIFSDGMVSKYFFESKPYIADYLKATYNNKEHTSCDTFECRVYSGKNLDSVYTIPFDDIQGIYNLIYRKEDN